MRSSIIICSIVFTLLGFACNGPKKPKPDTSLPPKYAVTSEPQFKYQGDLSFISEKGDFLKTIKVEIADTDATREKGLMYRHSMKEDNGMLFIFDEERRQAFWMKNTHIPLDIIFVNANFEIVHIAYNTTPYSLDQIPSFEYAQYVVEVNAGFCKKYDVKVDGKIAYSRK